MPETKVAYVRMDEELHEELSKLAHKEHRSLNAQIVVLLKQALEQIRKADEEK